MSNPIAGETQAAIYAPENLQRLIAILWNSREDPQIQAVLHYVALGAFAGLRPAGATALEWKQVDWAQREIRLDAPMVKTPRTIPIHDNLWAIFLPKKGHNGLAVTHKKVANLLRTECEKAGVVHISNGLRRSYGAYRMAESSPEIVAQEMGLAVAELPAWRKVSAEDAAKYFAVQP